MRRPGSACGGRSSAGEEAGPPRAEAELSLYTLFFLQTHHILPPIFSCLPTIFSEYSRNIPTENLPHTLGEQKNGAFEGEKGSPNAFLRDLSARNLSRMRNQQSTQLISCLDIINTK